MLLSRLTIVVALACIANLAHGIDLEIGGAPYLGTLTPSTPLEFAIVNNVSAPFAVQFSAAGVAGCVVDMTATGPSGGYSYYSAPLDQTVVWNPAPFGPLPSGIYHATLATRNVSCPVSTVAISEAPRTFPSFGSAFSGSLPLQVSANFAIDNPNNSQFAVSFQVTQGSCNVVMQLKCPSINLSSNSLPLVAGGTPLVTNTMSIPTSKYNAQNCTLGYQTTKGSCSYTLTLIEEPLISVGLNSKTTGQLSTGLGALYEIQAGQFNLALSGTSGACNVTSSYTASTGLSSTYSMQQISPYNAALTFSPMWQGPVSWVASYTAISGSCDYVLMITPL